MYACVISVLHFACAFIVVLTLELLVTQQLCYLLYNAEVWVGFLVS